MSHPSERPRVHPKLIAGNRKTMADSRALLTYRAAWRPEVQQHIIAREPLKDVR